MEKLFQLMMALGLLVTVRVLAECWKLAMPLTTWAPVGLASAGAGAKQAATAVHSSLRRNIARLRFFFIRAPRIR
jgi:hypothetical protein